MWRVLHLLVPLMLAVSCPTLDLLNGVANQPTPPVRTASWLPLVGIAAGPSVAHAEPTAPEATVSPAVAERTYTVRLKDGGVYADVTAVVDWSNMVVFIQTPSKPHKEIPFQQIEAILDAAGRDVTSQMLGAQPPGQRVALTLKSGEVFSDVRITIDRPYRVVMVHREGLPPRGVAFEAIARIVNPDGEDITARILGQVPLAPSPEVPAPPSQISESDMESLVGARKLPWVFGIDLHAGHVFPFGDWYEGIKAGPGYGGAVSLALFRAMNINIGYWHQLFRGDMAKLQVDTSYGFSVLDANMSVDRFYLEFRFLQPGLSQRLWGYAGYSVGAFTHNAEVTIQDFLGQRYFGATEETKFGMGYTLGLIYMFNRQLGVDGGARFDWVFGGTGGQVGMLASGYSLQLAAGLLVGF